MKKGFLISGVLLLLFLVAGLICVGCVGRSVVFPGSMSGVIPADADYGHAENYVSMKAEDGTKLCGWFFNRGEKKPLVMMFGGNAMNAGGFINLAKKDASRSYLMMNYRGYGGSEGEPSEAALVADSLHALAWAKGRVKPRAVILVGFSLGSGVATQVAAGHERGKGPDQLILICPFDSILEVGREMVGSVASVALTGNTFDSAAAAENVECPVVIFQAERDTVIPAKHTEALYRHFHKAGNTPQLFVFPAGHNDIISDPDFYPSFKKILK